MSNVQIYLQHLVGAIGPRPASSDTERVGAEWAHSVFQSHGLASDIQDFEAPRSRAVASATGNLTLVLALVLIGLVKAVWFGWAMVLVLVWCAACAVLDSRGRNCLSVLMPKGPSQNVIGRFVPHAKVGEKRRKVVLIAHIDSAVPTPLESPATGSIFSVLSRANRYITYVAPLFGIVMVAPIKFLNVADQWIWYALLVAALVPLVSALNSLLSLVIKRYSPGANSNASGVAALLAILDELAGEPKGSSAGGETTRLPRLGETFTPPAAFSGQTSSFAELPEVTYTTSQAGDDLPADFAWAPSLAAGVYGDGDDLELDLAPVSAGYGAGRVESPVVDDSAWGAAPSQDSGDALGASGEWRGGSTAPATAQRSSGSPSQDAAPTQRSSRGDTRANIYSTVEFAAVPESALETVSFAAVRGSAPRTPEGFAAEDVLGPDVIGTAAPAPVIQPMDFGDRRARRSLLDFVRRNPDGAESKISKLSRRSKKAGKPAPAWLVESESEAAASEEWLGLDPGFDATTAGESIGSWDNFTEDESGWKGGWAEGDPIEDTHFAEEEAARIRRRVAEAGSATLDDKEIWFVVTGAGMQGGAGMKALLDEYGAELRSATFINLDTVGEGQLHWLSLEGVHSDAKASARLVSVVKRVTRDTGTIVKPARVHGITTDATVALRARAKALTLTRLVNGRRPAAAATVRDDVTVVDETLVTETAEFVAEVVRQL